MTFPVEVFSVEYVDGVPYYTFQRAVGAVKVTYADRKAAVWRWNARLMRVRIVE